MTDYVKAGIIWFIDPNKIIELTGLGDPEEKQKLSWKVVVDYGAGVSWFLSSLQIKDVDMYELDPLYKAEGPFYDAIARNKIWVKEILEELRMYWWLSTEVNDEIENHRRVLTLLGEASFNSADDIIRVTDISEINSKIDRIFITSLLSALDNPNEFFIEVQDKLSREGIIYITETRREDKKSFFDFLFSNIRNFKWVSVTKDAELGWMTIAIQSRGLRRVIKASKKFKKG